AALGPTSKLSLNLVLLCGLERFSQLVRKLSRCITRERISWIEIDRAVCPLHAFLILAGPEVMERDERQHFGIRWVEPRGMHPCGDRSGIIQLFLHYQPQLVPRGHVSAVERERFPDSEQPRPIVSRIQQSCGPGFHEPRRCIIWRKNDCLLARSR